MANLASMMKSEITRLARREVRAEVNALKKQSAQYRRDIAGLKRQVAQLTRQVASLEKRKSRAGGASATPSISRADEFRFTPKWVKSRRAKLGLSAAEYGRLVGVSTLTIYNWEAGKTKPQRKQMAALAAIKDLGKREAQQRLEQMPPQQAGVRKR